MRDEIAGRAGDDDDASLIASKPEDKEKWCADVVARIEAIESTIQVMQNPPPPRHDLLNMYSGEIGMCVLVFYFLFLYQHAL